MVYNDKAQGQCWEKHVRHMATPCVYALLSPGFPNIPLVHYHTVKHTARLLILKLPKLLISAGN